MPTQILEVSLTAGSGGSVTGYTEPIASRWVTKVEVDAGSFTGGSAKIIIFDDHADVLVNDDSGFSDSVTNIRLPLHTTSGTAIAGAYAAFRTPTRLRIDVTGVTAAQSGTVKVHVQDRPPIMV